MERSEKDIENTSYLYLPERERERRGGRWGENEQQTRGKCGDINEFGLYMLNLR